MKEINKYMSPSEAAFRWGKSDTTLKNYLQNKIKGAVTVEEMIDMGHVKYFVKPGGKRKEWIISESAMEIWFPKKG
ncbi:DNA-binding protein [Bacillus cytotoxicus]|uniref:DNA-binding protein n=1 Tax=unclassified Bacillus cereus group TaxID=2750818 RepID=UPI001F55F6F8|nr:MULTISPECIES: DNA-binding protein [unclassified Bacillus cereus group]EMA6344828.1 DNA-binding protein [Bacillus cytotoxicus]